MMGPETREKAIAFVHFALFAVAAALAAFMAWRTYGTELFPAAALVAYAGAATVMALLWGTYLRFVGGGS